MVLLVHVECNVLAHVVPIDVYLKSRLADTVGLISIDNRNTVNLVNLVKPHAEGGLGFP